MVAGDVQGGRRIEAGGYECCESDLEGRACIHTQWADR